MNTMESLKSMVNQLKPTSSIPKRNLDEASSNISKKTKYMTNKEIQQQQEKSSTKPNTPTTTPNSPIRQEKHTPPSINEGISETNIVEELSNEEVISRLRSCGEPILLFAETSTQRIVRLRQVESKRLDFSGQRNEYAKQMAKTEAGLLKTNFEMSKTSNNTSSSPAKKPIVTKQYDLHLLSSTLLSTNPDMCFILVYKYLKTCLDTWENELDARTSALKQSVQGKHDYAKFMSTKLNLKPFFKLLKRKAVANDVMAKIADILKFVQMREYVKANDVYLQLSIGNAPWPIGVTMVGIHERSGREKIFSNQIAHVLNDETQRKWIQGVKRIMTFAQTKFPPDDPAKLVG